MDYYSSIKRNAFESVLMRWMYHNFFIHSSIDGHLGCFHVQAIVNSAAVNNGMHVSFSILVSSGYMPRVGLLSHKEVSFLVF